MEPASKIIDEMKAEISWYGHASFMMEDHATGMKIYHIDPFDFKGRTTKKADIVFITHAHFDHCSIEDLKQVLKQGTAVFAPSGCKEKLGVDVILTEPNKKYSHNGIKFRTIPAYNIHPSRLQAHPKANNWVGYIIDINGQSLYHAGDTDFIEEMKTLGKIDIAMLPIGGKFTMDVEDAIAAANTIKAKVSIPMHYKRILGEKSKEAEEKFRKGVKGTVHIFEEK